MIHFKLNYYVFLIFFFSKINAQSLLNPEQEKIANTINEYFKMDRENIHIHLNKNTFLTDEKIWFKGYIIENKSNKPYAATSNVYISLLDENGLKIATQLYFSENSLFKGYVKLNNEYKSGKYYLQVYTNYMNNFSEDESSIFEITIINPVENKYNNLKKINLETAELVFYPESGTFLEGVSNTMSLKITDCNENGIQVKNAEIVDSKGNLITTFSTNTFGYGKFEIVPLSGDVYKAIFDVGIEKIEKTLPAPTLEGITFSVNNYSFKDRTIVKLKTNIRSLKNAKQTLAIQHNEIVSFMEVSFKENQTEQTLTIPNDQLFEGISTLHLINEKGNKIGERVLYKPHSNLKEIELIVTQKTNDSIVIRGKSSIFSGDLSVSVLPFETDSENISKSIYSSFEFDNYLIIPSKNISYYLNDFTRTKHYELDEFLICNKSKYDITKMQKNMPLNKYDFDSGLLIKGNVNNSLSDIESHKIAINSALIGLNQTTSLNSKSEFLFKNVFVSDSIPVHFSLINKKTKTTKLNLYCQIQNNNRPFLKTFISNYRKCPPQTNGLNNQDYAFPTIRDAILLDSIVIVSKAKRETLVNENRFANSMSRAFKISDNDYRTFYDILEFIRFHGYNVSSDGANVKITRTFSTSIYSSNSPQVFMDDVPVSDFSILQNFKLDRIDEIYINAIGYGGGDGSNSGVIRIYTKIPNSINVSNLNIKSKSYIFRDVFQTYLAFKNPKYNSTHDDGFLKFGTIHWIPSINTNEKGEFNFSIPNLNQKTIKVIIEGISSEGDLISMTKTLIID